MLLIAGGGDGGARASLSHEIKKELKMPEYADWNGQDRLGLYIDVAYKSVKK